jgi:hypothetical protein
MLAQFIASLVRCLLEIEYIAVAKEAALDSKSSLHFLRKLLGSSWHFVASGVSSCQSTASIAELCACTPSTYQAKPLGSPVNS